jgi:cell division protein FtsW
MLFMAGIKARYFLLILLIGAPLVVLGVMSKDYRVERLNIFMAPERDPSGSGFQTLSAQTAIKNGALWGKGVGLGTRKLGNLPEAQSDFIFAVVAEELGFVGVLGIISLFSFFAWRGYRCAMRAVDTFDRLLAFGLTSAISLQALLNVAVTIGVVPPTGINLPFFSSGGSSLIITLCMVGLLYNISRRSHQSEEETSNG